MVSLTPDFAQSQLARLPKCMFSHVALWMVQKVQCLMLCKAREAGCAAYDPEAGMSCREEARSMFDHAFHNYLQHGFPKVSP